MGAGTHNPHSVPVPSLSLRPTLSLSRVSCAPLCTFFVPRMKDRVAAQIASAVRAAVEASEAEAKELAKTVRGLQAKLADATNIMAESQRVSVPQCARVCMGCRLWAVGCGLWAAGFGLSMRAEHGVLGAVPLPHRAVANTVCGCCHLSASRS